MGRSYFSKDEYVLAKEGLSVDAIKEAIRNITDEDFNGNNGEDYFTEVEIDGVEVSMSQLEASWLEATKNKTEEEILKNACSIIESIVSSNYDDDGYYEGHLFRAIETKDSIVCLLAYSYYN